MKPKVCSEALTLFRKHEPALVCCARKHVNKRGAMFSRIQSMVAVQTSDECVCSSERSCQSSALGPSRCE